MRFRIIRNDITKVKADAIVNTANPKPIYGGGTDSAIYKAAGEKELLAERKKIGDIAPGEAVETPAFKLNAKYIIHTVGPVWQGGDQKEFEILRNCYLNSLKLAVKLKCKSIAFPLIATGVYGFPKDKALTIAMSVIQPFVLENNIKVMLVVFDQSSVELSGELVENVREFVDSHYVESAKEAEYMISVCDGSEADESNPGNMLYSNALASARLAKRDTMRRNLRASEGIVQNIKGSIAGQSVKAYADATVSFDSVLQKKVDIGELVASSEKTFQEKLFEIIDKRGLKNKDVYYNYVSKQVFSKIQSDKDYHPNKYTAIALCLSLHLDVEETQDLLGRAGWALSPSSKADLVVQGCIINHEYNVGNIDLILYDFGLPELARIK